MSWLRAMWIGGCVLAAVFLAGSAWAWLPRSACGLWMVIGAYCAEPVTTGNMLVATLFGVGAVGAVMAAMLPVDRRG